MPLNYKSLGNNIYMCVCVFSRSFIFSLFFYHDVLIINSFIIDQNPSKSCGKSDVSPFKHQLFMGQVHLNCTTCANLSIHFFLLTSSTTNNLYKYFLLKKPYRLDPFTVVWWCTKCMVFNYTLNHLPHYNIKVLNLRI